MYGTCADVVCGLPTATGLAKLADTQATTAAQLDAWIETGACGTLHPINQAELRSLARTIFSWSDLLRTAGATQAAAPTPPPPPPTLKAAVAAALPGLITVLHQRFLGTGRRP
jgi:D-serine deaminase-like pyridoxal phosphate-dependent protein